MAYKAFSPHFLSITLVLWTVTHTSISAQPSFEDMQRRVEAATGSTVHLSCPISNLASRQVSWFKQGGAMLARGTQMAVNSRRFSAQLNSETPLSRTTYQLTITRVTINDIGSYYCQIFDNARVLTSPKIKLVVGAQVTGPAGYVDLNTPIQLTCQMPQGVTGLPRWFKEGVAVETSANYDTFIQGWQATANRGSGSSLFIRRARPLDTGEYMCTGILGNEIVTGSTVVRVRVSGAGNLNRIKR